MDTTEYTTGLTGNQGLSQVAVTHGASANAVLTIGDISRYWKPTFPEVSMLAFSGNDLAGSTPPYSRIMFTANPTNGYNSTFRGWARVGDEFATYDTALGIKPLPAGHSSRTGQVEGSSPQNNVLATSALTALTANRAINSLKIDGAWPLDLGGYTLTITNGGIIQTGANNPGGIFNGVLKATNLYVQAARDLTIGATIDGQNMVVMGDGKLSLTGATPVAGYTIYWDSGALDIVNGSVCTVRVDCITNASGIVKGGSGTLALGCPLSAGPGALPDARHTGQQPTRLEQRDP